VPRKQNSRYPGHKPAGFKTYNQPGKCFTVGFIPGFILGSVPGWTPVLKKVLLLECLNGSYFSNVGSLLSLALINTSRKDVSLEV
jgi:hypothetical protein